MARGCQGVPPPLRSMHSLPAHQRQAPPPHLQLVRKVWRCGGRESQPKKVKWTCACCRLQSRACVSGGNRPPAVKVEEEPAALNPKCTYALDQREKEK